MRVVQRFGKDDLATVYLGEMDNGRVVEFVESLQPPIPRERKWVLIVSTMFGCPVKCLMCDAGGDYGGNLSADEILEQTDFMVTRRYPDGAVPAPKFKVQFARMGEPALNRNVLEVLTVLPERYDAPGLMPCVSTVAPSTSGVFFEELLRIKLQVYTKKLFQLQFSIHTTDEFLRDRLMPIPKWSLAEIAAYGDRFVFGSDRKVTLNFAADAEMPVDPGVLQQYFSPDRFLVKMTPINPTYTARTNRLRSYLDPGTGDRRYQLIEDLKERGYEVVLSIGEIEENLIGSNCGQYVTKYLEAKDSIDDGYKSRAYTRD